MQMYYERMKGENVSPNIRTFNSMMYSYGKAGKLEEIELTFRQLEELQVTPDVNTYTTLIEAYGSKQLFETMDFWIQQMHKKGVRPDAQTYNIILNVWGSNKKLDKAKMAFQEMKAKGIAPTIATFNTLILWNTRLNRIKEVLEYYGMLLKEPNLKPNVITYNLVMEAHERNNDFDSAWTTYLQLKAR